MFPTEECQLKWDIIIITTGNAAWRDAVQEECCSLNAAAMLPLHDQLLVVEDPVAQCFDATTDGPDTSHATSAGPGATAGVGSGGATINAILIAAETLSAMKGHSMINSDDLKCSKVLLVHFGRPCSQTWQLNPSTSPHLFGQDQCPSDRAVPAATRARLPCTATPLLTALWNATVLAGSVTAGVWVSSVECGLVFPSDSIAPISAHAGNTDVLLCTVSVPIDQAQHHGLVLADQSGLVQRIIYKPTKEQCLRASPDGTHTPIISGQTFLSTSAAERLLTLHTLPPFTHCTYHATDSGLRPLRVTLYLELLSALCTEATRGSFGAGDVSECASRDIGSGDVKSKSDSAKCLPSQQRTLAWECAWKTLSGVTMRAIPLPHVRFMYSNLSELQFNWTAMSLPARQSSISRVISSVVRGSLITNEGPVLLSDVFVGSNVHLSVGASSVLLGLSLPDSSAELNLGAKLVWQEAMMDNNLAVITCHGIDDSMNLEYPRGGMFNRPWEDVLSSINKTADEVWLCDVAKTPLNARIFTFELDKFEQIQRILGIVRKDILLPDTNQLTYVSLADINRTCRPGYFLKHRSNLLHQDILCNIDQVHLTTATKCVDINRSLRYLVHTDRAAVFSILDHIHEKAAAATTYVLNGKDDSSYPSWVACCRLLAVAADVLSVLAGWQGNIRTGPAANAVFTSAFQQLQKGSVVTGVGMMKEGFRRLCRDARSDSALSTTAAATLTRAARHYQRAVHILIARQVLESCRDVTGSLSRAGVSSAVESSECGVWVSALCPARLDLAGGWTDTPPICYELGGAVLNVAITVNGQKPIIVRGRWMRKGENSSHNGVRCLLRSARGCGGSKRSCPATLHGEEGKTSQEATSFSDDDQQLQLQWTSVAEFGDYDNPLSPGALVKAALVYCRIVDLGSDDDLESQLSQYGDYLELEVISRLPPGSGLGGSSLVAGALLSVLSVLKTGACAPVSSILHATLALEQYMTTGGGWQDQVGGLFGGIKLGVSYGKLPVRIHTFAVPVSQTFLDEINEKLVLLYTGQVRLAKNLLQNVVRSWYSGDTSLYSTFHDLQKCALAAASAVCAESLEQLSRCINTYWTLKKTVAQGSEPRRVTELLSLLDPYTSCASLAGAGGGGYLYALRNSLSIDGNGATHKQNQASQLSASDSPLRVNTSLVLPDGVVRDVVQVSTTGLELSVGGCEILKVRQPDVEINETIVTQILEAFHL